MDKKFEINRCHPLLKDLGIVLTSINTTNLQLNEKEAHFKKVKYPDNQGHVCQDYKVSKAGHLNRNTSVIKRKILKDSSTQQKRLQCSVNITKSSKKSNGEEIKSYNSENKEEMVHGEFINNISNFVPEIKTSEVELRSNNSHLGVYSKEMFVEKQHDIRRLILHQKQQALSSENIASKQIAPQPPPTGHLLHNVHEKVKFVDHSHNEPLKRDVVPVKEPVQFPGFSALTSSWKKNVIPRMKDYFEPVPKEKKPSETVTKNGIITTTDWRIGRQDISKLIPSHLRKAVSETDIHKEKEILSKAVKNNKKTSCWIINKDLATSRNRSNAKNGVTIIYRKERGHREDRPDIIAFMHQRNNERKQEQQLKEANRIQQEKDKKYKLSLLNQMIRKRRPINHPSKGRTTIIRAQSMESSKHTEKQFSKINNDINKERKNNLKQSDTVSCVHSLPFESVSSSINGFPDHLNQPKPQVYTDQEISGVHTSTQSSTPGTKSSKVSSEHHSVFQNGLGITLLLQNVEPTLVQTEEKVLKEPARFHDHYSFNNVLKRKSFNSRQVRKSSKAAYFEPISEKRPFDKDPYVEATANKENQENYFSRDRDNLDIQPLGQSNKQLENTSDNYSSFESSSSSKLIRTESSNRLEVVEILPETEIKVGSDASISIANHSSDSSNQFSQTSLNSNKDDTITISTAEESYSEIKPSTSSVADETSVQELVVDHNNDESLLNEVSINSSSDVLLSILPESLQLESVNSRDNHHSSVNVDNLDKLNTDSHKTLSIESINSIGIDQSSMGVSDPIIAEDMLSRVGSSTSRSLETMFDEEVGSSGVPSLKIQSQSARSFKANMESPPSGSIIPSSHAEPFEKATNAKADGDFGYAALNPHSINRNVFPTGHEGISIGEQQLEQGYLLRREMTNGLNYLENLNRLEALQGKWGTLTNQSFNTNLRALEERNQSQLEAQTALSLPDHRFMDQLLHHQQAFSGAVAQAIQDMAVAFSKPPPQVIIHKYSRKVSSKINSSSYSESIYTSVASRNGAKQNQSVDSASTPTIKSPVQDWSKHTSSIKSPAQDWSKHTASIKSSAKDKSKHTSSIRSQASSSPILSIGSPIIIQSLHTDNETDNSVILSNIETQFSESRNESITYSTDFQSPVSMSQLATITNFEDGSSHISEEEQFHSSVSEEDFGRSVSTPTNEVTIKTSNNSLENSISPAASPVSTERPSSSSTDKTVGSIQSNKSYQATQMEAKTHQKNKKLTQSTNSSAHQSNSEQSSSSDVEGRVIALKYQLRRLKAETARLTKESQRQELRNKEVALKIQVQKYSKCIEQLKKQLSEHQQQQVQLGMSNSTSPQSDVEISKPKIKVRRMTYAESKEGSKSRLSKRSLEKRVLSKSEIYSEISGSFNRSKSTKSSVSEEQVTQYLSSAHEIDTSADVSSLKGESESRIDEDIIDSFENHSYSVKGSSHISTEGEQSYSDAGTNSISEDKITSDLISKTFTGSKESSINLELRHPEHGNSIANTESAEDVEVKEKKKYETNSNISDVNSNLDERSDSGESLSYVNSNIEEDNESDSEKQSGGTNSSARNNISDRNSEIHDDSESKQKSSTINDQEEFPDASSSRNEHSHNNDAVAPTEMGVSLLNASNEENSTTPNINNLLEPDSGKTASDPKESDNLDRHQLEKEDVVEKSEGSHIVGDISVPLEEHVVKGTDSAASAIPEDLTGDAGEQDSVEGSQIYNDNDDGIVDKLPLTHSDEEPEKSEDDYENDFQKTTHSGSSKGSVKSDGTLSHHSSENEEEEIVTAASEISGQNSGIIDDQISNVDLQKNELHDIVTAASEISGQNSGIIDDQISNVDLKKDELHDSSIGSKTVIVEVKVKNNISTPVSENKSCASVSNHGSVDADPVKGAIEEAPESQLQSINQILNEDVVPDKEDPHINLQDDPLELKPTEHKEILNVVEVVEHSESLSDVESIQSEIASVSSQKSDTQIVSNIEFKLHRDPLDRIPDKNTLGHQVVKFIVEREIKHCLNLLNLKKNTFSQAQATQVNIKSISETKSLRINEPTKTHEQAEAISNSIMSYLVLDTVQSVSHLHKHNAGGDSKISEVSQRVNNILSCLQKDQKSAVSPSKCRPQDLMILSPGLEDLDWETGEQIPLEQQPEPEWFEDDLGLPSASLVRPSMLDHEGSVAPYYYRAIPNKPPPPYTPPQGPMLERLVKMGCIPPLWNLPQDEEQVDTVLDSAAHLLYPFFCEGLPALTMAKASEEFLEPVTKIDDTTTQNELSYKMFLFDLSKEVTLSYHSVKKSLSPWKRQRKLFVPQPTVPSDASGFSQQVQSLAETALNMNSDLDKALAPFVRQRAKRHDAVDRILLLEMAQEEDSWVDYQDDEVTVKCILADAIFNHIVEETVDVLSEPLLTRVQRRRSFE